MTATSHSRTIQLINMRGLHARAATKLVAICGQYQADVCIRYAGREVKAQSLMSVMMLGAAVHSEIELIAQGEQAVAVLDALCVLINNRFDEEN